MQPRNINGFDRIAWSYDFLARLVYGKSIRAAQLCYVDSFADEANILILGGGTGWFLNELVARKTNCTVWYVEPSASMMTLTRKKNGENSRIHCVQGTIENVPVQRFDIVVTHFFLDLFPEKELESVVEKALTFCKPATRWIATDFVDEGRWWQGALLKTMYVFFRSTTGIAARKLPPWKDVLVRNGFEKIDEHNFYGGFIHGISYVCSRVI